MTGRDAGSRTRAAVALAALLAGFWLACSGHYSYDGHHPLVTYFGIGSCALVLALALRMRIVDFEAVPVHLLGRAFLYLPYIVKEVVLSNVDVALRVLRPDRPVAPEVIVVRPTQKTDLGRVLYANSITLTPGTVTLWVEPDALTVHSIAREPSAGLEGGEMDRRVTRLEGAG